ncbi:PALB protein [Cordyceps militaris]|uniref:PALB protein n=1 Tax=Cordyceps militaris TaxID=73501 RepID=A0A2H4S691_CORMI|nr:PALB protein [Cordyceps militaris]
MEKDAQVAEALLATSTGQAALDYAIQAAELYMRAASSTSKKQDAARFRQRCNALIAQAEKLKTQLPKAPLRLDGADILRQSSLLHGNEFPPWEKDPSDAEFQHKSGQELFTDETTFSLSPIQTENFASWQRPRDLCDIPDDDLDALMKPTQSCNLVQDITTDCSVVASLSAAIDMLTGKHSVLAFIIHPFNHDSGYPKISASGKYVFRMNFNGCWRRVVIDDRLPASRTDRTLFVVDRRNPRLIWPALLEKAYLKVRGGYDFPGSNSGTDLWVLTGWIPEQLFLQREDFDLSTTWRRIKAAHETQDVVVTLGTGRISTEEEEVMGLVGEHDYAVLDMDCSNGIRKLLIKNPWCNGPVWTGAGWSTPQKSSTAGMMQDGDIASRKTDRYPSGTLWVAFEDVAQHFESMYLNWNPKLFPYRQDRHFNWSTPPKYLAASLVRNVQYSVTCPRGGLVWALVSRHFVDQELVIMRNRRGSMAAMAEQLGYMSILIFEANGKRVQTSEGQLYRGPYVDSPQTLARLETEPGKQYTVVLDQQELPLKNYNFTLAVFSELPAEVREAQEAMSHFQEIEGSWSRRTAGGNSSLPTYFINPQYKLSTTRTGPVSILLTTGDQDVHVHVDLVWAAGKRVSSIRVKDLAGTSGEYRQGCAVANIPKLDPGIYSLVCSTFEANQTADFALRVSSTSAVELESVPADAAGRLRNSLTPLALTEREERMRAQIRVSWLTRGSVCVRNVGPKSSRDEFVRQPSSLMIRVYIVHGWGPEQLTVAESGDGEFVESTVALRTPEFDLEPERTHSGQMWLVVEIIGVHNTPTSLEMDVFSDSPVHVGPWQSW